MTKIFSILLCMCFFVYAESDEEIKLAEDFKSAIQSIDLLRASIDPANVGAPPEMADRSDAEKTRMIASYLFQQEGNDPYANNTVVSLLNAFPDMIQDDSELRRMLSNEKNARKFHILRVNLVGHLSLRQNTVFIGEMAHMLLRNDPVGRAGGEYHSSDFDDVSIGTYKHIVTHLKRLSAPFEEPPEDIPHEQRKLILARWLKANWPGCENLEISNMAGSKSGRLRAGLPAPAVAASGLGKDGREDRSGRTPSPWVWGSALLVLAASVGAWLRTRLVKA